MTDYVSERQYISFYLCVLEVAKLWPDRQWVIAIGSALNTADFESGVKNAIIVNQAPQISLLKRASLMITHGGATTVRECVYFGVPMIAFPLGFDQYGNTARVVYQGLGVEGDFSKVSVSYLEALIIQMDSNLTLRRKVRLMQQSVVSMERRELGVALVENFLQRLSHRCESANEKGEFNLMGGTV